LPVVNFTDMNTYNSFNELAVAGGSVEPSHLSLFNPEPEMTENDVFSVGGGYSRPQMPPSKLDVTSDPNKVKASASQTQTQTSDQNSKQQDHSGYVTRGEFQRLEKKVDEGFTAITNRLAAIEQKLK